MLILKRKFILIKQANYKGKENRKRKSAEIEGLKSITKELKTQISQIIEHVSEAYDASFRSLLQKEAGSNKIEMITKEKNAEINKKKSAVPQSMLKHRTTGDN